MLKKSILPNFAIAAIEELSRQAEVVVMIMLRLHIRQVNSNFNRIGQNHNAWMPNIDLLPISYTAAKQIV